MIKEVLLALRNQLNAGAQVLATEWGRPVTVMPEPMTAVGSNPLERRKWFELHHGTMSNDDFLLSSVMEELPESPMALVSSSNVWREAVESVFPQVRHVPMVRALIHDAIQRDRSAPHEGWSFRVDARQNGALMVAVAQEQLKWVFHLPAGSNAEDLLYAMVNAAHRSGTSINDCRVQWSGEPEFTEGWGRFLDTTRRPSAGATEFHASWHSLFQSLEACA